MASAWVHPHPRTRVDRGPYATFEGADTQPMVINGTSRTGPQAGYVNAMPGGVFQPGAQPGGQQYVTGGRSQQRLPHGWRAPVGQAKQPPWWLLRYALPSLLGVAGAVRGQLWLVAATAGYLAAMGSYRRWLRPVLAGMLLGAARAPFARAFVVFTVAVVLCCGGLFSSQTWRVGAQPALADAAGSLGSFGVQMVKGFMSKSDAPADAPGAGEPTEVTACKPTKKQPCDDTPDAPDKP